MNDTTTTGDDTSRPYMHEHLSEWDRTGHQVFAVHDTAQFLRYPALGQHLLAAAAEATRLGMVTDDRGVFTLPLTEAELDAKVTQAQRTWDRTRDDYFKAQQDPTAVKHQYQRGAVDRWAADEGLQAIQWDVEVSA